MKLLTSNNIRPKAVVEQKIYLRRPRKIKNYSCLNARCCAGKNLKENPKTKYYCLGKAVMMRSRSLFGGLRMPLFLAESAQAPVGET